MAEPELHATNAPEITVSELSNALKRAIEDRFGYVRVRGEISGYRGPHSSGHAYFSLKDANARLDAVIWRTSFQRMKLKPEEGLEVVAVGRLTTFPGKSSYQIVIEQLELAGVGALLAQLEARRKALAAEGLFDAARKKAIPFLPRVVGVVTSPTGAVIRDILHRLTDRFPVRVVVWPVRVQGETSAAEVAAAIDGFNALDGTGPIPRPDVMIVARGGGSLEDLMGFNEEITVRAAARSAIPLIAAVGHETDWTLIDHAADRRAPTPTAAAEFAVPVRAELAATLAETGRPRAAGDPSLRGAAAGRLAGAHARPAERRGVGRKPPPAVRPSGRGARPAAAGEARRAAPDDGGAFARARAPFATRASRGAARTGAGRDRPPRPGRTHAPRPASPCGGRRGARARTRAGAARATARRMRGSAGAAGGARHPRFRRTAAGTARTARRGRATARRRELSGRAGAGLRARARRDGQAASPPRGGGARVSGSGSNSRTEISRPSQASARARPARPLPCPRAAESGIEASRARGRCFEVPLVSTPSVLRSREKLGVVEGRSRTRQAGELSGGKTA